MILKSTLTKAQLLADAAELVQAAVKRGLMSYPPGTRFQANGTPIPNLDGGVTGDMRDGQAKHDMAVCKKAFWLRDRGLSLQEVAAACGVPKGSVHYLIAKGHEDYLSQQRKCETQDAEISAKTSKESP